MEYYVPIALKEYQPQPAFRPNFTSSYRLGRLEALGYTIVHCIGVVEGIFVNPGIS